jgi:thiamine transporter ThiT
MSISVATGGKKAAAVVGLSYALLHLLSEEEFMCHHSPLLFHLLLITRSGMTTLLTIRLILRSNSNEKDQDIQKKNVVPLFN